MDDSPLHTAHNAWLDTLKAGILAELKQNMTELKETEATMLESWIDVVRLRKMRRNHA